VEAELTLEHAMERNVVEFSEGEFIVRSYQCLVQKSAFSKASDGYLQVTNKRVIYANSASSGGTSSLMVSEVPLEDVGSITSFVGRSMNGAWLLPFVIISTLASTQFASALPEFMTHWLFGFFLMLPFIVIWLMDKNILNQELFDQILKNLEYGKESQRTIGKPGETLRKVLKAIFIAGLVLFVSSVVNNLSGSLGYLAFIIPLFVFTLIYLSFVGSTNEFGLFVSARSASGSGLTIKSDNFQALFGKKSPSKPGQIIPTADSYTVARELGALVMDLQQSGDLAIEKWSQRPSTISDSSD